MTYFKQGYCEDWLRQAIQTKSDKQQQTFDILCLESRELFGKFVVVYKIINNVMYCQVWWPILEIGALHLTHQHTHSSE